MAFSSFTPKKPSGPSPVKENTRKNIPKIDSPNASNDPGNDNDISLLNSLDRLSISSPSPRSPRRRFSTNNTSGSQKAVPARSPSTPRPASSLRSPLNGAFAINTPSRASTPSLLRKASMNSLHSANGGLSRRPSAGNLLSPTTTASPNMRQPSPEPPKRPTPESVATGHFKSELDSYHGDSPTANLSPDTIVILNDACYGHRYSRPRTTRKDLSNVVERPERIKASVMGVAAAYVRLSGRHEDGRSPIRQSNGPVVVSSVPFRIRKTTRRVSLMSPTVTNVHGTKWMAELIKMCDSAAEKLAQTGKELQREEPGSPALHEGDLYLCSESLSAIEGAIGGVCEAVDAVFQPQGPKRAFVAIRPPGHHCSDTRSSGFCWVNNVHIGIMHGSVHHGLTHAAIIDFDLHHGDGSQAIAWDHNASAIGLNKNAHQWKRTSIGYFSLHDINSYPCEAGDMDKVIKASVCIDNAHGQNIWNIHLQPWDTEAEFWTLYESKYTVLLDKTRSYLCAQNERLRKTGISPKGAIFLSAGFDASEWETPGMQRHNVKVPTSFYAKFTSDVVRIAAEVGTGVEGRIISVLEGGYSDRALCSGIMSHICGLAGTPPPAREADSNAVGNEVTQQVTPECESMDGIEYEWSWWSESQLDSLERIPEPTPEPRPVRNITPPTYSSPTQASVARSVNPQAARLAGSGAPGGSRPSTSAGRIPSPPPPEVPWTVATHALSQLLIPSGRQTDSCTAEELRVEAKKVRRERQAPSPEERLPSRMGLRERKPKPAVDAETKEATKARNERRKTVAGTQIVATPAKPANRPAGRRLSAASTIVSDDLDPAPPIPTEPLPEVPRAGTAMSVRPESSASMNVANGNPLPMRKARALAEKDLVPRATRTPKAAPKRLPNALPQTAPAKSSKLAPAKPATTPTSESPSPPKSRLPNDVNGLTNDVKKTKIRLLTPAMREAREQERIAKEKASSIDVSTPPSVQEEQQPLVLPDQQKQPTIKQELDLTPVSPLSKYPPVSPQPAMVSSPIPVTCSQQSPMQEGSSPTRHVTPPDLFVQYQPEGLESNNTIPAQKQGPLQWMPPSTPTKGYPTTPSPGTGMRREDLPVFTATSAIPFAPAGGPSDKNGNVNAVSSRISQLEEQLNGLGLHESGK